MSKVQRTQGSKQLEDRKRQSSPVFRKLTTTCKSLNRDLKRNHVAVGAGPMPMTRACINGKKWVSAVNFKLPESPACPFQDYHMHTNKIKIPLLTLVPRNSLFLPL
jgi:hypothetical protein